MAANFIGKPISLISHSDVRYRGILAGINPAQSTIQLENVWSMGTENRRPASEYIPPAAQPYQYIVFRAAEVKDLAVEPMEAVMPRGIHEDPAILGTSVGPQGGPQPMRGPADPYSGGYGQQQYRMPSGQQPQAVQPVQPMQQAQPLQHMPPQQQQAPVAQQPYQQQIPVNRQQQQQQQPPAPAAQASRPATQTRPSEATTRTQNQNMANGLTVEQPTTSRVASFASARRGAASSAQATEAAVENVEKAMNDLRVSQPPTNGNARSGGRRGGGRGHEKAAEIQVPATDFDFESSNARFDKAALADKATPVAATRIDDDNSSPAPESKNGDVSGAASPAPSKDKEADKAYNPKMSFFDSLSSSAASAPPPSQGGRGGARRGQGKTRREEERERNVATFGEPGGVGLMGPGAYVGGWGGYGRRGGGGRSNGGGRGGGRRAPGGASGDR